MPPEINPSLVVGALLSALAAAAHIGIIIGGAPWYRFFGAGEQFAVATEQGKLYPAVVTFGIAAVLATWSAYALSGAGWLNGLPFLKLGLCVITGIYLLRGVGGFAMLWVKSPYTKRFIVVSSSICLVFGGVHALGVW
ncbi:MAG: hypothetical protein ABIO88_13885 [Burkholderiaceae bacterium]